MAKSQPFNLRRERKSCSVRCGALGEKEMTEALKTMSGRWRS
jgi:hypothetical protein